LLDRRVHMCTHPYRPCNRQRLQCRQNYRWRMNRRFSHKLAWACPCIRTPSSWLACLISLCRCRRKSSWHSCRTLAQQCNCCCQRSICIGTHNRSCHQCGRS
jgi:hypothetical protein